MKLLVFALLAIIFIRRSLSEDDVEQPTELLVAQPPTEGIYQEPYIVYGMEAQTGQFPYMVHIYARHANTYKTCGGSLISDKHVLTAAHCVAGVLSASLGFGAIDIREPAVSMITTHYIRHENYNSATLNNDVAIYFLPFSVPADSRIKPIRLPSRPQMTESFLGATAVISGFGRYSTIYSTQSDILRYVYSKIIANPVCEANFGGNVVVDSVVCALGLEFDEAGTCHGDSGGPLVIQEGITPTQIGVVSFISSKGCGSGRPYGFARTASHLEWIAIKTGIAIRLR